MPPLPIVTSKDAIQAFERLGWTVMRQKGSHIILTKPGQFVTLSVPNHKEVARGTLRSLLSKANISIDDFVEALR